MNRWQKRDTGSLSLRIHPDSVLRQICEPVQEFDSELRGLVDEMLRLMRARKGIDLAAPQVGITRRLFVVEIEDRSLCFINPGIQESSGNDELVEGCLSFPGMGVTIARSQTIRLTGYDPCGRKQELRAEALWARVMQHEIDHLDGILICDHGGPVKHPASGGSR